MTQKGRGWHGESRRKSLAARRIKTNLPDNRRFDVSNYVARGQENNVIKNWSQDDWWTIVTIKEYEIKTVEEFIEDISDKYSAKEVKDIIDISKQIEIVSKVSGRIIDNRDIEIIIDSVIENTKKGTKYFYVMQEDDAIYIMATNLDFEGYIKIEV